MSLLLRFLSAVICALPERAVAWLGSALGVILFDVFRIRRRVALDNLRIAFGDQTPTERVRLARRAHQHVATSLLEFLRLSRYAREGFEQHVIVEGIEHYHRAKAQDRGVLCLASHLGSFELVASAMAAQIEPDPMSAVVKRFPHWLEAFVNRTRRGASPIRLLPARQSMRSILAAVKRREAVVFVLDQNATRRLGVFVDFFGRPACTMSGLAVVARRTKAPVIAVSARREAPGRHRVVVHPPIVLEEGASVADSIRRMTQLYTRFIEARIRDNPEQWLWVHRRFKTQPTPADASSASTDSASAVDASA